MVLPERTAYTLRKATSGICIAKWGSVRETQRALDQRGLGRDHHTHDRTKRDSVSAANAECERRPICDDIVRNDAVGACPRVVHCNARQDLD
jgi:hypothetical protein